MIAYIFPDSLLPGGSAADLVLPELDPLEVDETFEYPFRFYRVWQGAKLLGRFCRSAIDGKWLVESPAGDMARYPTADAARDAVALPSPCSRASVDWEAERAIAIEAHLEAAAIAAEAEF